MKEKQKYTLGLIVLSLLTGTSKLKEVVSDIDVAVIARDHVITWDSLSRFLGLTRPQEESIGRTYSNYENQKKECLEVWRQTKGNEATYGALINAAEQAKEQKLADAVKKMIGPNGLS